MLERLKQAVSNPDAGRLALRVFFFGALFLRHGVPKLFAFNNELVGYPSVFHIGPVLSLVMATFADGICSILAVLGFATRWAAAWCFCSLMIGWGWVHAFSLMGREGRINELIPLYLVGFVTVFLLGPGKYSIDGLIEKASQEKKRMAEYATLRVASISQ